MISATVQLLVGLILLAGGGHYLVAGAARIALLARISATVVGLTVVAMGTSMPELAVSVSAALRGSPDLAYANVIGSNIFNVGAVLAVGSILIVIPIQRQTIIVEYPFMLAISFLVLLLARDGQVDQLEGIFLVTSLVLFTAFIVWLSRRDVTIREAEILERETERTAHLDKSTAQRVGRSLALVTFGIVALVGGARLVVGGAVTMAEGMGIEERVIGLTVVAMGTSLPELTTTIVATRRGESDIALGNIIGSNIFNLMGILGATAIVTGVDVNREAISVDTWVMLAFSAAMLPMLYWGKRVGRRDGLLLLAGFIAYMTVVITTA